MMIDTTLFDATLAKVIDNHQALMLDAQKAYAERDRADKAIKDAEAADVAEVAAARVAGSDEPEPQRTEDAKRVASLAAREAEVASSAVAQSLSAVADEARKPKHKEAVDKLIAAQEQTSKNLLVQLEAALVRLQDAKAAKRWLDRPIDGGRAVPLQPGELFTTVEALRKKNGEFPGALDLTSAVREALEPAEARENANRFPGGFPGEWEYHDGPLGHDPRPVTKKGPAGQPNETAAARAFAEQVAEL